MRVALRGAVRVVLGLVVVGAAVGIPALLVAQAAPVRRVGVIGRSVQGRRLVLVRRGPRAASRRVLVVGCIHGNECAGVAVTRALRRVRLPRGVELLLVDSVNPDGRARGVRLNARGVDLNRNFPVSWRPGGVRGSVYYPGPRPLSEPEARAVYAFVRRERPTVSVWYHQHARLVYLPAHGDLGLVRRYARTVHLPARVERPLLSGTAIRWQNAIFHRTTAFVVELPAGSMAPLAVRRHLRAVLATVGAP